MTQKIINQPGDIGATSRQLLCRLQEIPDGYSKGVSYTSVSGEHELLLVRRGDEVFAYENSCPHTGVTLNWQPDEFMSFDAAYIQCAMHGALFRIHDGYCVLGPCLGQALRRVVVEVCEGEVLICSI